MNTITCDKCKTKIEEIDVLDSIDFFNGSLDLMDVDLCDKCKSELKEVLSNFTKE